MKLKRTLRQRVRFHAHEGWLTVKSWFAPWNRVHLPRLSRRWSSVDRRMEEAVFQLLADFLEGEQPFHSVLGEPHERNVPVARHRALLEALYGPAALAKWEGSTDSGAEHALDYGRRTYLLYTKLLDHLEWWQAGGLDNQEVEALRAGASIEDAIAADRQHDRDVDQRLMDIIQARATLWT